MLPFNLKLKIQRLQGSPDLFLPENDPEIL